MQKWDNFARHSKWVYHKGSVHHWKLIRKCGEKVTQVWILCSYASLFSFTVVMSSQVHIQIILAWSYLQTLITWLQATVKNVKCCLNGILSMTFLLSLCRQKQEPYLSTIHTRERSSTAKAVCLVFWCDDQIKTRAA